MHAVGQTDRLQKRTRTPVGLASRHASYERRHHDILAGIELGQKVVELKHEADLLVAELRQLSVVHAGCRAAVDLHRSAVGCQQRAHDLQEGRLAGTARADDRDHLAASDRERYAAQHLDFAEALADVVYLYHACEI